MMLYCGTGGPHCVTIYRLHRCHTRCLLTTATTQCLHYVTLLRCGAFFVRDPLPLEGSARRQQPELWRAVATRHHEPASCSVRRRTAVQLLANE